MNNHNLRNILLAVLVLALLAMASSALASPAEQPQAGAAEVGSNITYQGQLTDAGGNPLSGSYTMRFELYDVLNGGTRLWEQLVNSVPVQEGIFTVQLHVDPAHFDGRALWLAITVNGQLLSPRQELTPAPYALGLRPGARVYGDVQEPGIDVDNTTGVGIRGHSTESYGVVGATEGDTEWQAAGVAGYSTHDRTFGVLGSSDWGIGVEGSINQQGNGNPGVVGFNAGDGAGVEGYSQRSHGVVGSTDSAAAAAGRFENKADGPDLVLGGTMGTVFSDPDVPSSSIELYSKNHVSVDLDVDDDEFADFTIHNGADQAVFSVDENGSTAVAGDLDVGGLLQTKGPACSPQYVVVQGGTRTIPVPDFCIDAMCWIVIWFDGQLGAYGTGFTQPILYNQLSSNIWYAGPSLSLAGVSFGGAGVQGGGADMIFGAGSAPGGVLNLWDDLGAENSPLLWTVEFQPKAGQLVSAMVTACPMGQPLGKVY
jgi:hypothetical protein